jgi:2',3'-cyclic-nucleotide 2'-phosphodiesterase
MKILFLGDILGRGGRETIKALLPKIKKQHNPDIVIANAENLTHGSGFSAKSIQEMTDAGIDFFTSGNHTWSNADGVKNMDKKNFPIIRPANFSRAKIEGRGYEIVKCKNGEKILVINLIGRVFMKKNFECPFYKADEIIKKHEKEDVSAIFVDFHAEATSEKMALAFYLDGKVSAVIGTHTHVPTADYRVLEKGTAYMSDAGMTGPLDSVIGVKKELVIKNFLTQMSVKHEPETSGEMVLSGALIDIDSKTKKALNIQHIYVRK